MFWQVSARFPPHSCGLASQPGTGAALHGLLFRNVDADITYRLAQLANDNTEEPLPAKEFNRTFESILNKELRRRGANV